MSEAAPATAGSAARGGRDLQSIQILRAVAALGVLTHHVAGEVSRFGGTKILDNFVTGAAGVDLFFVISGFVMVYSSESLFGRTGAPRYFVLRRLARVVPLYWAVTLVLLGYSAVIRHGWPPGFDIGGVLASFVFIPYPRADGAITPIHALGWTLNYELFFYAVFAAAIALSRRAAVLAVGATFTGLIVLAMVVTLPLPFSNWFNPIILEFCFGMLIALAWREGLRLPWGVGLALVAAAIAGFGLSAVYGASSDWRALEWGGPSALLVAGLALARGPADPGPVASGFAFLGDASYSLYLVHPLVFPLVRLTLPRVIDFAPIPWALAPILFAASIAAAIASYLLFEKPITRALQKRIGRMDPAPASAVTALR